MCIQFLLTISEFFPSFFFLADSCHGNVLAKSITFGLGTFRDLHFVLGDLGNFCAF